MGNETTRNNGGLAEPPKTSINTGGTTGGTTGGNDTRNSRTATGNADTGRTAGTATGTTGGTTEKEKTVGVASVTNVPAPEQPKKKQQRKTTNNKKKKTAQKPPQQFSAEQLSALILTGSNIIASRPNMQIWQLQEQEALQLATPLANMIAKSEKLQNAGEYADAIALVTASLMIFAPRVMVQTQINKQKKLQANGGVKIVRTDKQKTKSAGTDNKPARNDNKKPAADVSNNDTSIYAAIPATL